MVFSLTNLSLILAVLTLLLSLYCLWQIKSLNKLRSNFFAGSKAMDLESVIESLKQELGDSHNRQSILEHSLKQLHYNLGFAVQKVGIIRFNPFNDGGGNLSFSLALLDEHNNGIILTSMHGREQNRIYTKKLDNGSCAVKLTDEEEEAVAAAENKFRNK